MVVRQTGKGTEVCSLAWPDKMSIFFIISKGGGNYEAPNTILFFSLYEALLQMAQNICFANNISDLSLIF